MAKGKEKLEVGHLVCEETGDMNYTLRRNAPDFPNRVSAGGWPVAAFKRPYGRPHTTTSIVRSRPQ
jgi:hypothetical protein